MTASAGVRVPLDQLGSLVGTTLPPTAWVEVTQTRIETLAAAVGDTLWFHLDAERAAEGPFGATIAQGALTLGLVVRLWVDTVDVEGSSATLSAGFDRVRFPAPVRAGDRIRAVFTVTDVRDGPAGVRALVGAVAELDGNEKPACAAELVLLFLRA